MQRESRGGRRGKANTDRVAHMHRLKLSSILFWFLAALSAALLLALALIVGGVIPIDPASQPPGAPPDAVEQPQSTTESRATARIAERVTTPVATTPTGTGVTVVVLSAVRGDSWFSARVDSESGPAAGRTRPDAGRVREPPGGADLAVDRSGRQHRSDRRR